MWSPICEDTLNNHKSSIDWYLLDKVRPEKENKNDTSNQIKK